MSRQHVQAGACMDATSGALVRCVLEKPSCTDGSTFVSSHQIHTQNLSKAQACLSNESVRNVATGRCKSELDNQVCTSSASNCQFANTFQSDSTCTVLSDTGGISAVTYAAYGSCVSKSSSKTLFCGWSSDDCPEKWLAANHAFTHARGVCNCDRVQTGQCTSNDGQSYCAVSKNGCDDESTWTPASSTSNCYLCMTGTVVSTETSLRPYQEALNAQKQKNPYITVATKQNEAIVGIVVAMVCVALVAGIVIHKVRRRRRLLQAGKSNTPSSSKSGTNTNTDGTEVVEEMELELAVANKTID